MDQHFDEVDTQDQDQPISVPNQDDCQHNQQEAMEMEEDHLLRTRTTQEMGFHLEDISGRPISVPMYEYHPPVQHQDEQIEGETMEEEMILNHPDLYVAEEEKVPENMDDEDIILSTPEWWIAEEEISIFL